jgi:aminoglycoside 6'-N-acetyltransferase I
MTDILIRKASPECLEVVVPMWRGLFPNDDEATARREIEQVLLDPTNSAVFLAQERSGTAAGFLHVGLRREYVAGCTTSPVGYLEAWFVNEEARRKRIGAMLVRAGENWAREKGCTEMGSDCELDNDVSLSAHIAIGYQEVNRVIEFRKTL